jgi:hypothetical protein
MNTEAPEQIYEELASRFERQHEPRQRDICLVLAADAALAAGHAVDAERLRARLLAVNPHHLLRPYASLADALTSSDIQDYVADLRRLYPLDQAAQMLHGDNGSSMKPLPVPATGSRGAGEKGRVGEGFSPSPPLSQPLPSERGGQPSRPNRAAVPAPSPYERLEAVLRPDKSPEVWGQWIALLLFVLVGAAAGVLAWYVLVQPMFP